MVILLACLLAVVSQGVNGQQSGVQLTSLMVTNHFTGGAEITRIAVALGVTNIDNLAMLQVEVSATVDYASALVTNLTVVHKDGVHYILYTKDNLLPVSGKPDVIFFIDVPDQLTTPYPYIRVTGVDSAGQKTNTVQFIKK
jgi:hypothetical protein